MKFIQIKTTFETSNGETLKQAIADVSELFFPILTEKETGAKTHIGIRTWRSAEAMFGGKDPLKPLINFKEKDFVLTPEEKETLKSIAFRYLTEALADAGISYEEVELETPAEKEEKEIAEAKSAEEKTEK